MNDVKNVLGVARMPDLQSNVGGSRLPTAKSTSTAFTSKLAVAQSQYATAAPSAPTGGINERALSLHAYRLQLLASNIANVDTPGYKAVDIDVSEALRKGQSVDGKNIPLKYHVPSQDSMDGNTVEIDVEMTKFAESSLRYQFSVDRVRGYYKNMEDVIKNTP